MADKPKTKPTPATGPKAPSTEHKAVAHAQFTKAKEAAVGGQYDYAIELLTTCCRIDPSNFFYRQVLRKTQKDKYGNNLRGSRFAFFSVPKWKAKVKAAKRAGKWTDVLELGEHVLTRNPWDLSTQMDMAEAFDALGLSDLAVFTLDQARQKHGKDTTLNRALARLFEKRGDFQKAIALWEAVLEKHPTDVEAAHKAKNLAASETIKKGGYEEAASGTRESPAIGRMTDRNAEKADKVARDADPILKRIESNPTEPTLYVQLAAVYRRHGQDDRARNVLQQALGPTGDDFRIRSELMEADLAPVRKNLEATEARLKALKAKAGRPRTDDADDDGPTAEELAQLRAKLLKEVNSREIDLFRVRADRFPNEASNHLELGIRLLKADLADEAIAELQQARKDEKFKWKAAMYLGFGFKKRNNARLAQRNFEEALASLPATEEGGKKELLFQLATGAADGGDLKRATELGHELANLDYAFKGIGKLLDEWHERLGE